ncbi:MAG: hypothetical protein R3181_03425, partial [Rubricoccaceae bacterium]|nr:hypothetical protein [Rubricoccaceae bacterium]
MRSALGPLFGPLLALLVALPAAAQPPADPLRVMLIGDSITEGDDGGYRLPLYARLTRALGAPPNFVGHRNGRL